MSTLDLLLKIDEAKIKKPTRRVEIKRLSELVGEKVVFTCEAVTHDRLTEIQEMSVDYKTQEADISELQIQTVLSGIKEPDLKNKELMEKFKAHTPKELLKKMLLTGEITNLYNVISELSGFGAGAVEEIKN